MELEGIEKVSSLNFLFTTILDKGKTNMSEQNKTIVRNFAEEIWNKGHNFGQVSTPYFFP